MPVAKENLVIELTPAEVGKLIHAPAEASQRLVVERLRAAEAAPIPPGRCDCGRVELAPDQSLLIDLDEVRHRSIMQCWHEEHGSSVKHRTGSCTPKGSDV